MQYRYFEELPVWKDARFFVKSIYRLTTKTKFKNDFSLIDQLRRASTSILLNIAEGFERKSNKDFARFINQAKASSGECRAILYIAFDLEYITEVEFTEFNEKSKSLSYQLAAFEKYLISTHVK